MWPADRRWDGYLVALGRLLRVVAALLHFVLSLPYDELLPTTRTSGLVPCVPESHVL